jgi:hypothetical protein
VRSTTDLRQEAQEALDRTWFVQRLEETERTDLTLSLRLHIRAGLYVQVFWGERSGSLYLALIEGERRIFGIDRETGECHLHPYDAPNKHVLLPEGLEPKPLLRFLARVEDFLLEHDLL